jgi:hypothetical protein
MSIAYTELTSRQDALKTLLDAAGASLGRGLPSAPGVYLGPARETPDGKHFGVFVARSGLPELEYHMGVQTGEWTVEFELALQSYWPESAEKLETYCGYFAANLLAVLHDVAKRSGTDGWDKGIIQSTSAIRLRREGREGAFEIEVVPFRVTFEVSY